MDPQPPHPVSYAGTPPVATAAPNTTTGLPAASMGEPAVRLVGASRDYGSGSGVFGIDLDVPPGSIVGVVGPSGAGKTTTIRLITGALDPSSGTVRVLGEDPRYFRHATRERVGYMPQLFALSADLTADENVDFVASLFGMLAPRRRRRVAEVLRLVELWDDRTKLAGALSGGMQRRLELACAMVHEPDLLILDEPTAGIDPILREAIWAELARLKDDGRTMLISTQYMPEADACDAIVLISGGHVIEAGPPEDLRRRAAGGDVIEAETDKPFDPEGLVGDDGIRSATSTGFHSFRIAVDDAGAVLPVLDDLVAAQGASLVTAREIRLSFDEVFTALVEQAATREDAAPEREPGPHGEAAA